MSNENSDILIYVPFSKIKLNETEMNWLKAFQTILEISLRQILKTEIGISTIFQEQPIIEIKTIAENHKTIIQLLLNNDFDVNNLLNETQFETKKIVNVICIPNIKNEFLTENLNFNLFDELLNKPINLTEHIHELKNEIWLKFLDITYVIKKEVLSGGKIIKKSKGKIFVAETSADQNFNRETIIRELEHLGFEVLPKMNFPKDLDSFSELVYHHLSESFLSIHLIGNSYTPLLNNIDISSIELQNDLFHEVAAKQISKDLSIKRLVWIPPDVKPKSEKQKLYIESFKRNIELLKSTEIIQTPIEVFKTIIRDKTKNFNEKKSQPNSEENRLQSKSVYLISNSTNQIAISNLKQELEKHKIKVLETTQKTNKIDLIQEHYHHLIHCDALLIDYSVENSQWLNSKLSDILKSPGFGRKKRFLAKTILLNSEETPQISLPINDLNFINNEEKNCAKRLNSFIEKIEEK